MSGLRKTSVLILHVPTTLPPLPSSRLASTTAFTISAMEQLTRPPFGFLNRIVCLSLPIVFRPLPHGLIQQVLRNIASNTRSQNPISQTPTPEIALTAAQDVQICPARDTSKHKIRRQRAVPGVCNTLLQRDEREVQQVSEQVHAQDQRGQESRKEDVQSVCDRMVVGARQRKWRSQAMRPVHVQFWEIDRCREPQPDIGEGHHTLV